MNVTKTFTLNNDIQIKLIINKEDNKIPFYKLIITRDSIALIIDYDFLINQYTWCQVDTTGKYINGINTNISRILENRAFTTEDINDIQNCIKPYSL